jgi:hypothetical protein
MYTIHCFCSEFLFWSLVLTIDINCNNVPLVFYIFFMARMPLFGPGPPHCLNFTNTLTLNSSGQVITPAQRPVPDNIQHSEETGTHAPSEIRTRIPRKWATADSRLRPRGSFPYCPCQNSGPCVVSSFSVPRCQRPVSCVIGHRVTSVSR